MSLATRSCVVTRDPILRRVGIWWTTLLLLPWTQCTHALGRVCACLAVTTQAQIPPVPDRSYLPWMDREAWASTSQKVHIHLHCRACLPTVPFPFPIPKPASHASHASSSYASFCPQGPTALCNDQYTSLLPIAHRHRPPALPR